MIQPTRPCEALEGVTLDGGWTVLARTPRGPGATGSNFSVPYRVERTVAGNVETAFLKALDFTMAMSMPMPFADALKALVDAYVFERDLVGHCRGRSMRNVVRGIDAGEVVAPSQHFAPQFLALESVSYILFEEADGDVRQAATAAGGLLDRAWAMRVLHGVANGLRQLHDADIEHQDLKPSNVMTFDQLGKVGDLGRASPPGGNGPFDATQNGIAGDATYAPPELLYGDLSMDEKTRRRACDSYQLGSLAAYLTIGSGLTGLLVAQLDPMFHWTTWPNDYRNVLPYVRDAFDCVLNDIEQRTDLGNTSELVAVVRELADPDPYVRGNPRVEAGPARYSMHRYVSVFDRLARSAELKLRDGLV